MQAVSLLVMGEHRDDRPFLVCLVAPAPQRNALRYASAVALAEAPPADAPGPAPRSRAPSLAEDKPASAGEQWLASAVVGPLHPPWPLTRSPADGDRWAQLEIGARGARAASDARYRFKCRSQARCPPVRCGRCGCGTLLASCVH
jgi:hypothetical protein